MVLGSRRFCEANLQSVNGWRLSSGSANQLIQIRNNTELRNLFTGIAGKEERSADLARELRNARLDRQCLSDRGIIG